jgi:hypothetical protein
MNAIEFEYRPTSRGDGIYVASCTDTTYRCNCACVVRARRISTLPRCSHTPCHDRQRSGDINRRNTATFELPYRGALLQAGHGSATPIGLVSMRPPCGVLASA